MSALTIRMGAAQALPLDYLLSQIPSLPRHVLDRLVERAIDRLDEMDGDPDQEANGDELDGLGGEDDFIDYFGANMGPGWYGAGCPISDPGEDNHDQELTDEREIEEYAGGHPNEYGALIRTHITA